MISLVPNMEAVNPELVTEMLVHTAPFMAIDDDEKATRSVRSGRLGWEVRYPGLFNLTGQPLRRDFDRARCCLTLRAPGRCMQATPAPPPCGALTRGFATGGYRWAPTAASSNVGLRDYYTALALPSITEAPEAMLRLIEDEPDGVAAQSYRRYIQRVLMPSCRRVTETLSVHGAFVEWPGLEWLQETYPIGHPYGLGDPQSPNTLFCNA
eukprot:SAG31_NODE_2063_length_6535_cov_7.578931_4_plen_210_part_00